MIIIPITVLNTKSGSEDLQEQVVKYSTKEEAKRMANAIKVMRARYTKIVIGEAKRVCTITHDYADKKWKDSLKPAIPLPATLSMDIAKGISKEGTNVQLYSKFPFPWRDKGGEQERTLSDFQSKAWDYFVNNHDGKIASKLDFYEFDQTKNVLNYAIPDLMVSNTCVNCHNTRAGSPKTDWKIGDVRGAISIQLPLKKDEMVALQIQHNTDNTRNFLITMACIAGLIFTLIFLNNRLHSKEMNEVNQKLAKEKELAVQGMNFRTEFLANMSHEIRTPMNGVVGMVDVLINDTNLDPVQHKYASVIKASSMDLLSIINDVLDLSKLQAGKMTIEYQKTCIETILSRIENLFTSVATEKKLTIITKHDSLIPTCVNAGEIRIIQVLSNLVSNAVKFSNEGEILIESKLISKSENGLKIKISVRDSGVGISKEDQRKLFSEFQQLDQSSTKKVQGTGLGLALSKKFSEKMGGKIGVESEIGKGSTFWFTFDAQIIEKSEANSARETAPLSDKNTRNNLNLNVLLVDDKKVNLTVASLMLAKLGCKTENANNGKEAVELFEEGKYDLILMDIQMPEMDGVEATRYIKDHFKNVPPIIGLSANAMEGDAEKYIALGLDDYIHKPLLIKTLLEKLRKYT